MIMVMKVVDIPQNIDEFRATVDAYIRQIPTYIDFVQADAKVRHARYLALIKEGFDEEQALILVKD
jgi:hypothetical protein